MSRNKLRNLRVMDESVSVAIQANKFTYKIKSAIFLINSLCVVKLKAEKIYSSDVEFHRKA